MSQNVVTKEKIKSILDETIFETKKVYDKCTVVSAKLPNGFIITESSACVDPSNYDEELGKQICIKKIEDNIWELEGYKLQSQLYLDKMVNSYKTNIYNQDKKNNGNVIQNDNNFIAKFEKVSQKQFSKEDDVMQYLVNPKFFYEEIKLPKRATKGSAGYDFFLPYSIEIQPHDTITISTGIRCIMDSNYVLMIFPRSGLGFKYGLRLNNSVGVIDSDFAYSDNEGNIKIKLYNPSDETIRLLKGVAFCQGIFLPYGIAEEEEITTIRNGGLGSTSK